MPGDMFMKIGGLEGEHSDPHKEIETISAATVQLGENNLSQVADRLGIDKDDLLLANPQIKDPSQLNVGQEIHLPLHPTPKIESGADNQQNTFGQASKSGLPPAPIGDPLVKSAVQANLMASTGLSPQQVHGQSGGAKPGRGTQYIDQDAGVQQSGGPATSTAKTSSQVNDLEDAIRDGDVKKMEALVKSGINVNDAGSDGKTPLMVAAEMGNTDAIKFLIQNHADPNKTGDNGKTPLMAAAKTNQDKDTIDLLVQNGAEINKPDNDGNTALMIAASKGNNESVNALLGQKNVNLDATRTTDGKTALILAAEKGNNEAVVALAQAGANPNIQGKEANNKPTDTALMALIQHAHDAGQQPDMNAVKALINASPNAAGLNKVDKNGRTAMMRAASFGDKDVVIALAKAKANPDIPDPTTGRTAIMDLLSNVPPDKPLSRSEADALVKASSNLDQRDKQQRTALMEAAKHGQTEMVVALVDSKKVDVDKQDMKGRTALMELGKSNPPPQGVDMAAVKALIHASKDLNKKDINGTTALMEMSKASSDANIDLFADAVRELNKAGANLNLQDNKGKTALMYAAESGNRQVVRYLLDTDYARAGKEGLRKADPSVRDYSKPPLTALDWAKRAIDPSHGLQRSGEEKKRFDDIVDMLQKAPIPHHAPKPAPLPDWRPRR